VLQAHLVAVTLQHQRRCGDAPQLGQRDPRLRADHVDRLGVDDTEVLRAVGGLLVVAAAQEGRRVVAQRDPVRGQAVVRGSRAVVVLPDQHQPVRQLRVLYRDERGDDGAVAPADQVAASAPRAQPEPSA